MNWRAGPDLEATLEGKPPPWADRFVRRVGSAVHRFGMIGDGDGVLVGVSGGKDSLALCLALELRRRRVRDDYALAALLIDWDDDPADPDDSEDLRAFFRVLGVPFGIRRASRSSPRAGQSWGCYECSRARKRELFRAAREAGLGTVALGHTLDDMAETLLLNLAIHARFEGMEPSREFFGGSLRIVRPLCTAREGAVRTFAERMGLPIRTSGCPRETLNPRRRAQALLVDMAKIDRLVREHLFAAYMGGTPRGIPAEEGRAAEPAQGAEKSGGEGRAWKSTT